VPRRNRSQRLLSRIERAKKVTTRRIIDFVGFAPITEMKRSMTMGGSDWSPPDRRRQPL
jgi:hypothetical protein